MQGTLAYGVLKLDVAETLTLRTSKDFNWELKEFSKAMGLTTRIYLIFFYQFLIL